MRETYKGYTLMTMSRPFTPKELFQAVQIKRDGFIVHDCLIGDLETAKRFVDLVKEVERYLTGVLENTWQSGFDRGYAAAKKDAEMDRPFSSGFLGPR